METERHQLAVAVDAAADAVRAHYGAPLDLVDTHDAWETWQATADGLHGTLDRAAAALARHDASSDPTDGERHAARTTAPRVLAPSTWAPSTLDPVAAALDLDRRRVERDANYHGTAWVEVRCPVVRSTWETVAVSPRETLPAVPMPAARSGAPAPRVTWRDRVAGRAPALALSTETVRVWQSDGTPDGGSFVEVERVRYDDGAPRAATFHPRTTSPAVHDPRHPVEEHAAVERAASALMRAASVAAGCPRCVDPTNRDAHHDTRCLFVPSADVFDTATRGRHVRPDAVAFRGTARVRRPSPVRVFGEYRTVRVDGVEVDRVRAAAVADDGTVLQHVRDVARSTSTVVVGWHGHRRYMVPRRPDRVKRSTSTQSARRAAGVTTSRGPAVHPVAMSSGAVRRRFANLDRMVRAAFLDVWRAAVMGTPCHLDPRTAHAVDVVRRAVDLERVLVTSTPDAPVTFGTATVTVVDGTAVRIGDRATVGIREGARRMALAGVDPLD